ncbi:putative inhibitor of apoptosis [Arctopsyche grandis]|uniref:putative inhibitor of apoptosis n=1 Tax=Arctopsyche grandis TaxID=121162 RepID=UPI00406D8695
MANMLMERDRLKTLVNWPVNFIDKRKMAVAGFYYEGNGSDDRVRCFQCKVVVGQWEPDDEPNIEHIKWSSNCRYITLLVDPLVSVPIDGPRHQKYANFHDRMKTFEDWPVSLPVKPVDLAKAGFFYKGNSDKCCCFYCDSVIKCWVSGDDPWEEHARWNPSCVFLHTVKDEKFIKAVQKKYSSKTSQPLEIEDINAEEIPEVDEQSSCKICFQDRRSICFLPCGHILSCANCAFAVSKCPACRTVIEKRQRIYFS